MLKRSSENAIRALVYIQLRNWEGSRPGITEIAREIEAPFAFTAKILQTLTRHLLINSIKGRGGGFFFSDDGYKLRLYDVIVVMEGNHLFKYFGFGFKK